MELKDGKASLEEEKVSLCAERDSLQSQAVEKEDSVVSARKRLQ